MATAAELETKTYWCHECDMCVSLTLLPSPLLCLHCHTSFLELMASPFSQNNVESHLFSVVFHDALLLLSPKPLPAKPYPLPSVNVTPSLLPALDPNGIVFCAVCKDQISLFDAEAKQLPCKHLYHAGCITPWLDLHASCPLCRLCLEEEAAQEEEDEGNGVVREIRREPRDRLIWTRMITELWRVLQSWWLYETWALPPCETWALPPGGTLGTTARPQSRG
ncbi:hypothetical protein VIGAN_11192900 [Vigna angularis var. angularis]|uniref:RING-type E3 ubiquitin transferase n=1 Tax=Vigna angularis var. angularis TaxID=157739 RepID=A0A0S3TBK5_PHAAN|nr:hypothetical protein VIGAN_11192900 [Vigna angularis var. angularis]